MTILRTLAASTLAACSLLLTFVVTAAPAQAQATRTWVSGVGDDVNPCSRTAPCKTFAGAISKTAAGGEINCLDPGGFGAVTITKSITIDCEDTQGSILASSTNGVNVNDSASGFPNTIRVILRGLSINGAGGGAQNAAGNTGTGLVGVNFVSGASVTIDTCIIQNFNAGSAAAVRVTAGGNNTELYITNSVLANNGAAAAGGGVDLQPTAGVTRAVISESFITNSLNNGVRLNAVSAPIVATVTDSVVSGHVNGVVLVGTSFADLTVQNSTVTNNSGVGIQASGANARGRAANNFISGNGTGVSITAGAVVNTYGTNRINGNTTDGTFSLPAIGQQ